MGAIEARHSEVDLPHRARPIVTVDRSPAVWFPAVRAFTGTDVFTERLCAGLNRRGIRAEITWLPLRAEYAPWTVPVPVPPAWATICHANTWLHSRFLPKQLPIVATIHHSIHDPALRAYKSFARAAYHRHWITANERRVLRHAARVVAVSQFVANVARRMLADVPIQVIYNGVDVDKFQPGPGRRTPGEPFRLLYIGSWKKLKGVDLLAPIMRELGDRFELLYTGGLAAGHDRGAMPSNMHDIGHLNSDDEVAAAMQNADALLFPSRSEGFGLVASEAMACGLPVIATHGSSLVEVVDDGTTGILCRCDNVGSFASAAVRLALHPELFGAMRLAARQRSVQYFSASTMVESYANLYRMEYEMRA